MCLLEGVCSGRMQKIHILSVKPKEELNFSAFARGRGVLLVLGWAQYNMLLKQFGKGDELSGEVPSGTLFSFSLENQFYTASFKRRKRGGGEGRGNGQECLEWDVQTGAGRDQGLT